MTTVVSALNKVGFIRELRAAADCFDQEVDGFVHGWMHRAADQVEAQEREITELRKFVTGRARMVIVHETTWDSVVKDVFTFLMILGILAVSRALHSPPVFWVGMAMFIFALAIIPFRKRVEMTAQDAANWLAAQFGAHSK
jgi:hypothetical protein